MLVDDNEISDVIHSAGVDQLRHDVVPTVESLGVWKHQTKLLEGGKYMYASTQVRKYVLVVVFP